jgi:hypothetical protein
MVTYEAKVKIDGTIHTFNWDANEKIAIPTALQDAITSPELVRLLSIFRALRTWMDTAEKQEIRISRTE